jgi:hypothetical protein
MQVLFFHGLPLEDVPDVHLATWVNGDGLIWPQDWLVEDFPGAHIFFVKYDAVLKNVNFHLNNIGENLISDLLLAKIGQVPGCPVVLVGHCIGGLVIKALCGNAHFQLSVAETTSAKSYESFLANIGGIFYYSTPHNGIRDVSKASHLRQSPFFKFFEVLSTEASVLNSRFERIRRKYSKWKVKSVGESLQVQSVNTPSLATFCVLLPR